MAKLLLSLPRYSRRLSVLSSETRMLPFSTETADDENRAVVGSVESYMRDKACGFLKVDDTNEVVFIHQSGIKSLQKLPPDFKKGSHPFLLRSERVRFIVKEREAAGKSRMAKEVEYEDGSPIPIYRSKYVKNVADYEMAALGKIVFETLGDKRTDEEEKQAKVVEAYGNTVEKIEDAQKRFDDANALLQS